jgi:glutamyl-tRNA reductase
MRVAAGLDSLVLGEAQILGQVNRAYRDAVLHNTAGAVLSHLFMRAIHAGKRARNETGISRYTTSISHAAANLARTRLGALDRLHALVVGAGEMARLAAEAIQMQGVGRITVINRTYSSAERLAADVGGEAVPWEQLDELLAQVDLVMSATGAPHVVIRRADAERAMVRRNGRMLAFFDVALPRDVEEEVCALSGVTCYDVDDLQDAVDENIAQRTAQTPHVEAIIAEEAVEFQEWLREREVVPVIVDMRQNAHSTARAEVAEAMRRVRNLAPESADAVEEVVERLAHRLVNKLLHEPTVRLKEHASTGDGYAYAHAVRELFALETLRPPLHSRLDDEPCTGCTICTGWPVVEASLADAFLNAVVAPCSAHEDRSYLVALAQEAVPGD